MNILEVKDLCKTYIVNGCQNNVLKNVNFNIRNLKKNSIRGIISNIFSGGNYEAQNR